MNFDYISVQLLTLLLFFFQISQHTIIVQLEGIVSQAVNNKYESFRSVRSHRIQNKRLGGNLTWQFYMQKIKLMESQRP